MHDVLVHYLEVNFPEIADQLAHARGRQPSNEERAAAAERWHEPRASASELIAGVNGELSPDERKVLDHFFELFARSMERTRAATPPPATVAEPVAPVAPAAETAATPEASVVTETETAAAVVESPEAEVAPAVVEPAAAEEPPAE